MPARANSTSSGALFPWRTINGDEASAAYQAGTAQYHINADIAYAIRRYLNTSDDGDFLVEAGAELLVETARMWEDLGFYADDGQFHVHSVTGPDEYTTVVNDNTYTNLMARLNLNYAAASLRAMEAERPAAYAALVAELKLRPEEREAWERAAAAMYVPYDERRGMHPQDANFLEREVWDLEGTPPDRFPLLLHYHPLVIYRHQVIKQADVVLAMFLLGNEFSQEQKRANFDYYDSLTTGDSSLSACIQSIVAAEVGEQETALDYFRSALLMDLADAAGNTIRRRPHRLGGWRLAGARVRLWRRARVRRGAVDHPAPACPVGFADVLAAISRPPAPDPAHPRRGDLHGRRRRCRSSSPSGRAPRAGPWSAAG